MSPSPKLSAILVGVLVAISGKFLAAQAMPARRIVVVEQISAPEGSSVESLLPPPTWMEIREAVAGAMTASEAALDSAAEAIPELPWGEHGLSNVEINLDSLRLDAELGRYVQDLPDGSVAVTTLHPALQDHLITWMSRYNEPAQAVVVIEPETGRVLAMTERVQTRALPDDLARSSAAWAASVFKVITGAALLEGGFITNQTETCYSGGGQGVELSHLTYNESRDTTCLSFAGAMAHSGNIVFARHADQSLSPAELTRAAERFGFNIRIPFEMSVEPSRADLPTTRLEFAQAAAGFRHTTLSPLHGAMVQAAIANEGRMMVPALVESVLDSQGVEVYHHNPTVWRQVASARTVAALESAQAETCRTGTARSSFFARSSWPRDFQVWGKTGTLLNRGVNGEQAEHVLLYTWFTGYGELRGRRLAVSSLAAGEPLWWVRGKDVAAQALTSAMRMTEPSIEVAASGGGTN